MQLLLPLLLLLLSSPLLLSHAHNISVALSHHPVAAFAPAPSTSTPTSTPSPPSPKIDLISLMSRKGCKTFAALLSAGTGDAAKAFSDSVDGGLTVFCPTDGAIKPFLPKFKNLTSDQKLNLLLYHGIPVYNSVAMLKQSNGVVNTLATDGTAKNYNFTVQNNGEVVTLESAGPTASIKSTLVDKEPLAVYAIDAVLEPVDLFKPVEAPVPAPAVSPAADAPEGGKKGRGRKKKHAASPPAPSGPEEQPADQKVADENGGGRAVAMRWVVAVAVVAAFA